MPITLTISLVAVFICVAMASGLAVSRVLSFSTTGRKRLRDMATVAPSTLLREDTLVEAPNPASAPAVAGLAEVSEGDGTTPTPAGCCRLLRPERRDLFLCSEARCSLVHGGADDPPPRVR